MALTPVFADEHAVVCSPDPGQFRGQFPLAVRGKRAAQAADPQPSRAKAISWAVKALVEATPIPAAWVSSAASLSRSKVLPGTLQC